MVESRVGLKKSMERAKRETSPREMREVRMII